MAKRGSEAWKKIISEAKSPRAWREARVADLKNAFALGATDADACIYAGIDTKTLWRWEQKYPKVRQEIERAKTDLVLKAYQRHATAVVTDPKYALDYLRLKRSEEFKPVTSKVELSGGIETKGDATNPALASVVAGAVSDTLRKLNEEANKKAG